MSHYGIERQHWETTSSLVGLPGMPARAGRAVHTRGRRHGWIHRKRAGRTYWLVSSLPPETREALAAKRLADAEDALVRAGVARDERGEAIEDARYDILKALDRWFDAERPTRVHDGRNAFVAAYNAGRVEVDAETRATVAHLSHGALVNWLARYHKRDRRGLRPESSARRAPQGLAADPEMKNLLLAALEAHEHLKAPMARNWLIARLGAERVPSAVTLRRHLAHLRETYKWHLCLIWNPDKHRSKYEPAFGKADENITRINQRWELDSTPADVLCTDGRHCIVGAIDVFTRRFRPLVSPTSRATAIVALLRRCIIEWGIPEAAVTDQGMDFISRHVEGALHDIGIEHHDLPAYYPQGKPFIERVFHTLAHGCQEYLPGFIGHNVAERQALRERESFAGRRGKGDAELYKVALTAQELQKVLDDWVEHVYEHDPHEGLNDRTPFEAAAGQKVRRIENPHALDALLAPPPNGSPFRKIMKKGIKVDGGTYVAPDGEFGPFVRTSVKVRIDPTDLGRIHVFASDTPHEAQVLTESLGLTPGEFWCHAYDPDRTGISRAEVAAKANARERQAKAEGRALAKERKRGITTKTMVAAVIADRDAAQSSVVPFPTPPDAHETPALAEAARAIGASTRPKKPPMSERSGEAGSAFMKLYGQGA